MSRVGTSPPFLGSYYGEVSPGIWFRRSVDLAISLGISILLQFELYLIPSEERDWAPESDSSLSQIHA